MSSHSRIQNACFSNITLSNIYKKKASRGYTRLECWFMEPDIASFDLICEAKQPLGLEFTNEQWCSDVTTMSLLPVSPLLKKNHLNLHAEIILI